MGNEFMRIELCPDSGFFEWNELKELLNKFRIKGWEVETIAVIGGFKFFIKKKLIRKDKKTAGGEDE